jgi:DNA-binding GntR family transcriptional regulator
MSAESTLTRDVIARLHAAIRKGEYAEGSQLPSERELAEQFGVSRVTIRRALKELELAHLIHRRGTSGTFVSPEPEWTPGALDTDSGPVPHMPTTWHAPAVDRDRLPRSGLARETADMNRIIELAPPELISPGDDVRLWLRLGSQAPAIRRLRLVLSLSGVAYELWYTYYPAAMFEDLLPSPADYLLDRRLSDRYGQQHNRVSIDGQVRFPTAYESYWLHISRQTPIVDLRRVVRDQHDEPIELSRIATPTYYYTFARDYEEEGLEPRNWHGPPAPYPYP